jgi:peroxiredoxin
MIEQSPKSRTPVFLVILFAGILIIGSAVFPFLLNARNQALQGAGLNLPPATLAKTAPALSLTDLSGKPVSLADYKNKVILINNWATWCPPCIAEIPELQKYYAAHAQEGFVLIGIESGEPAKTVSDFVHKHGLTYPIWIDPTTSALEAFNNWDLPSSYLVDRDGLIRMEWTGQINQETLETYVTPLLEK